MPIILAKSFRGDMQKDILHVTTKGFCLCVNAQRHIAVKPSSRTFEHGSNVKILPFEQFERLFILVKITLTTPQLITADPVLVSGVTLVQFRPDWHP